MNTADLKTARLRLVAITPESLDIQEHHPEQLAAHLNTHIATGWPSAEWEPHVYAFMRDQFRDDPHTIGWHRYVILEQGETPTLIGGLGAHPKSPTEAEFGYGILEPWQGKGYATEASKALITYLFEQGNTRLRAQTYPSLPASMRVMQKCGMVYCGSGDEEGTICYALSADSSNADSSV